MTAREDKVIRNSIDGCKDVINLSLDLSLDLSLG